MPKGQLVYRGKTKDLFRGLEPDTLVQHFRDDITAGNGERHSSIAGKGALNNLISEYLFTCLGSIGIVHHMIRRVNMREQLVCELEIIPVEVVVRNVAAGSLVRRLGVGVGTVLSRPLIEFYYKSDELNDPLVSEEHILLFDWAGDDEIREMVDVSTRINDYLRGLFHSVDLRLIDFKLEFGRGWVNGEPKLILADEITPDSCRLWDRRLAADDPNRKCDKDRFRENLGQVEWAYQEVARRLGVLPHKVSSVVAIGESAGEPLTAGGLPRLVTGREGAGTGQDGSPPNATTGKPLCK